METITSRQNPLCTHLRKLAASVSYRRRSGEFLCDSPKLLEEALLWQGDLHTVVCTEHAALPPIPEGVRLVQVPPDVMKSVSPAETPQGVLSVCGMPDCRRSWRGSGTLSWTAFRTPATWAPSSAPPTPSGPTACCW